MIEWLETNEAPTKLPQTRFSFFSSISLAFFSIEASKKESNYFSSKSERDVFVLFFTIFLVVRCIPYDKPNLAFIISSFVGRKNFLTDGFSSQVFPPAADIKNVGEKDGCVWGGRRNNISIIEIAANRTWTDSISPTMLAY